MRFHLLALAFCIVGWQAATVGQGAVTIVETLPPIDGLGPSEFAPLATGPSHILLASHTDLALFRKVGATTPATALVARTTPREFFRRLPGALNRITDPDVIYDPLANRFFIVYGDTTTGENRILLAVSKTPQPASLGDADWVTYGLPRADTADEGDFDHLAITANRLLISWQRTRLTAGGPLGDGTIIRVLDKQPFLDGTATAANGVDLRIPSERNLRARPAAMSSMRDRSERDRIFYDIGSQCENQQWTWAIAAVVQIESAPVLQARNVASPFPCLNAPTDVPQPAPATRVRTSRLAMNPAYRDGRLWLFEWNDGAREGSESALFWVELDVSRWPDAAAVVQSGVLREAGSFIHAAAGAVNDAGSLVVTYVGVGPQQFPVVRATGRVTTDPPGSLRAAVTVEQSARAWQMPSSRLATVLGASVDPSTNEVWITGLLPAPSGPAVNFDSTRHVIARIRVP